MQTDRTDINCTRLVPVGQKKKLSLQLTGPTLLYLLEPDGQWDASSLQTVGRHILYHLVPAGQTKISAADASRYMLYPLKKAWPDKNYKATDRPTYYYCTLLRPTSRWDPSSLQTGRHIYCPQPLQWLIVNSQGLDNSPCWQAEEFSWKKLVGPLLMVAVSSIISFINGSAESYR